VKILNVGKDTFIPFGEKKEGWDFEKTWGHTEMGELSLPVREKPSERIFVSNNGIRVSLFIDLEEKNGRSWRQCAKIRK